MLTREDLVGRLIDTWDGDNEELIALVRLIGRIRARAIAAERERIAAFVQEMTADNDPQDVAAERERCAQTCDDISVDRWKRYKKGTVEEGRADPFMEGQSHGADACAAALRALE
jgi:hypothetical protein